MVAFPFLLEEGVFGGVDADPLFLVSGSAFFVCLPEVEAAATLAYARGFDCSLLAISLATTLRSMKEKFRLWFMAEGGGGVLETLSGYSVSLPHFVTANRMCFP